MPSRGKLTLNCASAPAPTWMPRAPVMTRISPTASITRRAGVSFSSELFSSHQDRTSHRLRGFMPASRSLACLDR